MRSNNRTHRRNPGGTYFLIDGQASQVPLGGGGGLLRVAGGPQAGIIRGEPGSQIGARKQLSGRGKN